MSEPPCTVEKLREVLVEIINETKNALRELTMKSTLKKAEERLKLKAGDLNGWHRQWADDILVEVLATMLEKDPAIADSLDEEAAPAKKAKKAAKKPAAKKSEKKEEKEDKKEPKKEDKKEEKTKKEDKKDAKKDGEKKEKKVTAYSMYLKGRAKDAKPWKDLDEKEKAEYQKKADEVNARKEKTPVKNDDKKSPKSKAENPEKKKKKEEETEESKKRKTDKSDKDEEPAAKKSKPDPKAKKPRAKKAAQFYIAANKDVAVKELGLEKYNMTKCQSHLHKKFKELSDADKAKWIKMEEDDAKRVQKEIDEQK